MRISNCIKISLCRKKDENEVDRLSSFHDSILCHILSCMPTKDAARTSVLSKRWKNLFLDVPKLDFSDNDELLRHEPFIEFLNRRLMLCKTHTSISDFRLVLERLPPHSVINLWILALLFRNLKVLEIKESDSVFSDTGHYLPSEIFGWETLVELKLSGCQMVLKFPKSVIFPNLKVLDLEYLKMQSESESSFVFDHQSYPLLEFLSLGPIDFECSKEKAASLGLFLCTLKTLYLYFDDESTLVRKIEIDTPSLRKLDYTSYNDENPVQLSFRKNKHLIRAYLYSEFHPGQLQNELLSKVNSVKDLYLARFKAEDLNCSLPHFSNLTKLYLSQTGVESMLKLLQRAPSLKYLVLEMQKDDTSFVPPTDVPLCLAKKLRHVNIRNFVSEEKCMESDVRLVQFILQHGAVLEKVTLEHPALLTQDCITSTLKRLLMLPRCSLKCKIELLEEKKRGKLNVA